MSSNRMIKFGFEDLDVWQQSVDFTGQVIKLVDVIKTDRKHYRLIEQLEACSTSISLNIAEGKGRFSKKEFIQYLYIARGSLYETMTLLIIFHNNNWITEDQLEEAKMAGDKIGKMLSSLIASIKKSL